jgi:hypothetical protein
MISSLDHVNRHARDDQAGDMRHKPEVLPRGFPSPRKFGNEVYVTVLEYNLY